MILSQKDKADRNCTKLKEIQEKINNRYEMLDGKQGKMLASLLDKPFSKIKINRLVKEEGFFQRSLLLETNNILVYTKEHFSLQFERKRLNFEEIPDKWKTIYKPKNHIQKSSYYLINEDITEEE